MGTYLGNLYFITGDNSDPSGTTYDGVTNIQESVIKTSPDLSHVIDLFATPSNWAIMDQFDRDFSAGGIMLLPPRAGAVGRNAPPNLAVAADKDGDMFLMNQENLGGYYKREPCAGYISHRYVLLRRVLLSGSNRPHSPRGRQRRSKSRNMESSDYLSPHRHAYQRCQFRQLFVRNHGFFTTVSSNGLSNPIIWALGRQTFKTPPLSFYAFDPEGRRWYPGTDFFLIFIIHRHLGLQRERKPDSGGCEWQSFHCKRPATYNPRLERSGRKTPS